MQPGLRLAGPEAKKHREGKGDFDFSKVGAPFPPFLISLIMYASFDTIIQVECSIVSDGSLVYDFGHIR